VGGDSESRNSKRLQTGHKIMSQAATDQLLNRTQTRPMNSMLSSLCGRLWDKRAYNKRKSLSYCSFILLLLRLRGRL